MMVWALIYVSMGLAWQNGSAAVRVRAAQRGTLPKETLMTEVVLAWLNSLLWPVFMPYVMVQSVRTLMDEVIRHRGDGLDVLASAAWDRVVETQTELATALDALDAATHP